MKNPFKKPPKPGPESHIALRDATKELEKTQARWPDVYRVASALRELRVENNFSNKLSHIAKERR